MFVRILALFLAASAATFAQEFRGTVLGRVTDPSGAVVSGAAVSVTNEETNVRVDAKSNADGNFNIPFLLPGKYTVRVEAPGFKAAIRPGIVVQINDRVTLDFSLELGATSDTITVTAETPDAADRHRGHGTGGRARHDRAPADEFDERDEPGRYGARRPRREAAARCRTGRTISSSTAAAASSAATTSPSTAFPTWRRASTGWPSPCRVPMPFRSSRSQPPCSMRRTGAATAASISFTTRGGTNNFHGSAYYFFYDELLNANGWVRNRNGQARSPITQYLFGGTIGGPVVLPKYNGKNRTFFFFNYEKQQTRERFHPLRARAHRTRAQGRLLADPVADEYAAGHVRPLQHRDHRQPDGAPAVPEHHHSAEPAGPHRPGGDEPLREAEPECHAAHRHVQLARPGALQGHRGQLHLCAWTR